MKPVAIYCRQSQETSRGFCDHGDKLDYLEVGTGEVGEARPKVVFFRVCMDFYGGPGLDALRLEHLFRSRGAKILNPPSLDLRVGNK
jgi:hypothetical protein